MGSGFTQRLPHSIARTASGSYNQWLRANTEGKTSVTLARTLSRLRPSLLQNTTGSIRHVLRTLARRWLSLDEEAKSLDSMIHDLVKKAVPQLVEAYGISTHIAAEILIVVGDTSKRIKSEAALTKLAGVSPIPTSSRHDIGTI